MNTSAPPGRARDVASEFLPTKKSSASAKSKPPVSNQNYRLPASASLANSKRNSEESFHDHDYPSDSERPDSDYGNVRAPRDSHDLSLPTRNFTRDSLLGNMLNSLDQFSLSQINTPIAPTFEEDDEDDDDDLYGVPRGNAFTRPYMNSSHAPPNTYTPRSIHEREHSYSSDFEVFEDAASKLSSQISRGRRSNSSSGFQPGLPGVNSMRERSYADTPSRPALQSRRKSSSANSFDMGGGGYAQVLPTQRWDHAAGVPNSIVPGGSHHVFSPSSSSINQPGFSDHEPISPERKMDARSRSVHKAGQSKYATTREAAAPLRSHDAGSAPAPHVGYQKPIDGQQVAPASAPPAKDKPGFFSRLFGSSRSNPNQAIEPTAASASPVVSESQQAASESKPLSAPPTRDAESSRPMPHVIQKKSSFFRRRKKSIVEPPLPPLPNPVDIKGKNTSTGQGEQSPVSSLREVMTPYLKNGVPDSSNPPEGSAAPTSNPPESSAAPTSGTENSAEKSRKVRGFSPDYEPSPTATIRTVKSTSALKNRESRWQSQPESPIPSPPDFPSRITNNPDATFFHDSSDEGEKRLGNGSKQRQRSRMSRIISGTAYSSKVVPSSAGLDSPKPETSRNPLLQESTSGHDTQASLEVPSGLERKSTSRSSLSRTGSNVPSVVVDSSQASPRIPSGPLDEPEVTVGEPTEDDLQKAQGIFDGDESFIQKEKAAAWMGEEGLVRQRTLRAYMDLYDFENQSVLAALRQVCSRLVFRAETQQVDRILVAFSNRWCDCNPNHGFKSIDVIHTMCYSIMLLNTDLHLADIEQKMTKNQFIKNTMSTVTQTIDDLGPEETLNLSATQKNALLSPANSEARATADTEQEKPNWRASFKPLPRSESSQGFHPDFGVSTDTCGPLVKAPFDGSNRAWESQMEVVLKDIYTSIRNERLPLFGASATSYPQPHSHAGGFTMMGKLKRSPSVLSKAPSESQASVRGRINEANRIQGNRWISKSRSRPRLANGFSSSRTSFEDSNSIWSPAASSATWSRHSLGRTQTSMSMESFGSAFPTGDYQQSIGFANALSQAIIRDDYPVGNSSQSIMSEEFHANQLLEDESLELLGPPWVKEGMITHKHHLDGVDKKAKDRNWSEVFAVVQKGTMSIFSFSTKSMRQKARVGRKPAVGAVVGGGNWQENATSLGSFSLRHTLASALPAPGYSRSRPHVWALSLPSGAVHLFQVGTPEIGKEFILTVNYWSARLSTHPLVGGISNIEYGWSDAAINSALIAASEEPATLQRPGSSAAARPSTHGHSRQGSRQSSLRSSFDVGGNPRAKLPGDRIHIADWAPPSQSLRPSQCSETEQLETLLAYVKSVEDEFQLHNQLRSPMLLAFTPRGPNAVKSMANWERKSSYLLREIVKFRTYVDSLQQANDRRKEIYIERENARRAARGEDIDDDDSASVHSIEADTATNLPAV
ncbi:hypothetical protein GGR50DRAFT_97054 [Xylaria sp. CBS 124048]|nr:hypothetical protein GGR50DRAFT_97054 [Xylaria sp. CBS 124048]